MIRSIRPPRARHRPRTKAAFLLVALFLLVQVFQAYHFGAIRHRQCDVHDQLEHCDAASAGAQEISASAGPRLARGSERSSEHPSDHLAGCLFGPLHRDRIAQPDVAWRLVSCAAPAATATPATEDARHEQVALLRLAPSHSPPI